VVVVVVVVVQWEKRSGELEVLWGGSWCSVALALRLYCIGLTYASGVVGKLCYRMHTCASFIAVFNQSGGARLAAARSQSHRSKATPSRSLQVVLKQSVEGQGVILLG